MANPGDKVKVITKDKEIEGTLIPSDKKDIISIKLTSGYNIGIEQKNIKEIKVLEKYNENNQPEKTQLKVSKDLKTIAILHTGGTIASKVDYKTGAVVAKFSPEELIAMFPEISSIANIRSELVFQMFSEDLQPEHWQKLAKAVDKHIKEGIDGIIIAHGTDTMTYSSAALSFMLENCPIPVIYVGAQRSSDRGSSDAAMNMICAAQFVANTDFKGVAICMHSDSNDNECMIIPGTKARKMHTSRRDAFRAINAKPIAKIDYRNKNIAYLEKDYNKTAKGNYKLVDKMSKKVAIIKARPGFSTSELKFYSEEFEGIIIEGTGLGHISANKTDELTDENEKILNAIRDASKKGVIICMASQCINGRVNMDVYSTGRYLQEAGVIPCEDMLSETAYVKLMWLLGNYSKEETRKLIKSNLRGEILDRTNYEEEFF